MTSLNAGPLFTVMTNPAEKTSTNREYAILWLADENVAKKSRIMMLLTSP